MPISIKIDVSKIDKTKFFKGAKGLYLDLVLIEKTNDQYGDDFMCVQSVSKEDRAAGIKGAILGNAKHFGASKVAAPVASPKPSEGMPGDPPSDGLGW